jgi:CheY-like chemotaxis protein
MNPAAQKTVLLVDDDEAVRGLLRYMLEAIGFDVIVAADGPKALQKFRECRGEIDLLLTDIRMPKMSGIQLAQKVQLERPETRVLLMSGSGLETSPLEERLGVPRETHHVPRADGNNWGDVGGFVDEPGWVMGSSRSLSGWPNSTGLGFPLLLPNNRLPSCFDPVATALTG